MNVLVTGATGFVGAAVFKYLQADKNLLVTGSVRTSVNDCTNLKVVGDVGPDTDWSSALQGIDVVVHLAARAHVMKEVSGDPLAEFRRINVEGALTLARQAAVCGVKRFVFISSIGVNGSVTESRPFTEDSVPAPHADYAISKFEAEQAIASLAETVGMELVIIRPPLVYAAHAPGNFKRLLKLVSYGLPLPLAMIDNRRSMVSLENLVDFIALCVSHPLAANQTFLVSDGEDLSIVQMLSLLSQGMNARAFFLPVPPVFLSWLAAVSGNSALYNQLCKSLQVDSSKCRRLLNWTPPVSARSALLEVGKLYKAQQ